MEARPPGSDGSKPHSAPAASIGPVPTVFAHESSGDCLGTGRSRTERNKQKESQRNLADEFSRGERSMAHGRHEQKEKNQTNTLQVQHNLSTYSPPFWRRIENVCGSDRRRTEELDFCVSKDKPIVAQ
jgi:hypothetical protein